ncbi:MAG: non-lysosomal glucosylceramidase [Ardenticatenia bacterium]|nr:non-lysosomal glucosylceramidase [Ardenticatenia bacterium]
MVEQFSHILPHNYRESSYPVALFLWTVENTAPYPVTVGLLFTWESVFGLGCPTRRPDDFTIVHTARTEPVGTTAQMVGLVFTGGKIPATTPWEGSFALAALADPSVQVTFWARFQADGDGADIWHDFAVDGRLDNVENERPVTPDEHSAGGVAATITLAPGESHTVPFVLAWDLPIVEFGGGDQWYRRYTTFFGTSGQHAWAIAREGLTKYKAWRAPLSLGSGPCSRIVPLPLWYKTALFNELYFVADGATAWVVDPEHPNEMGHFAQIECYDYPFYETLDVRFYGSFPVVMLWPELEKRVMYTFISTVFLEDTSPHPIESTGRSAPRKLAGAVPHDLGAPQEAPWRRPNAYTFQDTNIWKDLNSKFVLLLYRDYMLTRDQGLLRAGWPAVRFALEYLKQFDRDNDGLPENENFPDQTYDTWSMRGASAYCGGLWLAALEAAQQMARLVNDRDAYETYSHWLERGREAFEAALWNGSYFRYDTQSPYREHIMADQLAGQWYADLTGLPPIVPEEQVVQALHTIFEHNVCQFAGGNMGAVNGMRPDGTVDTSSDQAEEVWSGVTYALASAS